MSGVYLGVLAAYLVHAVLMHRHAGPETEGEETQLHRGMPAPLMPITLFFVVQALASPAIAAWLFSPVVLGVAGLFILLALLNQLRRKRLEAAQASAITRLFYLAGGVLQTVLLAMACYTAYRDGVLGRSLFDPEWVILGLLSGHVVFGISLLFSHRSLETTADIARYVLDFKAPARFAARSPRQLFACLDISLIEELVYRVAAQGMLLALTGNPWIAIPVTAAVFAAVHRHFFYNHIVDSIEFLAFSLLLGALYYWTGSLMLVVLIHTVRNLEIVFFDQQPPADDESQRSPDGAIHHRIAYHKGLIAHAR